MHLIVTFPIDSPCLAALLFQADIITCEFRLGLMDPNLFRHRLSPDPGHLLEYGIPAALDPDRLVSALMACLILDT